MPTPRPFQGIDGEGAGIDASGRQIYRLLVAGDAILNNPAGISTVEALEFLLSRPRRPIMVGYYFDYDTTMILRDVEERYIRRIFERRDNYGGTGPYTWWRGYGLSVVPGFRFVVCRIDRDSNKPIRGTARTVHNVSGFFRMPFVAACKSYGVGTTAELRQVKAGKAARGSGDAIDADTIAYCRLECRLLAELMEKLRDAAMVAGVLPSGARWEGPGMLANTFLREHRIPRRPDGAGSAIRRDVAHVEHHYPEREDWQQLVKLAQFGGRSETRLLGQVEGPIWIYDLRSAYPAALLQLPCPRHTHWHRFRGAPSGWRWYIARGRYQSVRPDWGALPARRADQSTAYPRSVEGAWWSPELDGLEGFKFAGGYGADRECDCRPWDWVSEAYLKRQSLGPEVGYPIKVSLAALYGKLAQYRGQSTWRDIPAAGLVTSWVRRRIRDALWLAGDDAIMVATDAIYSHEPLPLHCGAGLGEWRESRKASLAIVQPGIHFADADISHRGFQRDTVSDIAPQLIERWRQFLDNPLAPLVEYPSVEVDVQVFVGHRLAISEEIAGMAGSWRKVAMPIGFSFHGKRENARIEGAALISDAISRHQKSVPYDPEHIDRSEKLKLLLEAQPDATL